ncbi:MAG: MBOAT family O-acyltransferase [Planctomycetaceae bacterium]
MLFHTSTFLVFFIVFLTFYLPARRTSAGPWVILVFSNIFYGWWNVQFLGLLWTTILCDFTLSNLIARSERMSIRKLLLVVSMLTNLGILGFFKYYNFFLSTLSSAGATGASEWQIADLTLPVGISFYIFQSLSYTLDVYRREQEPITSLIEFAAFVCYFPQLVAGPIERLNNLLPQITKPSPITADQVTSGGFLFCIGFFRKSIADTFATFVDPVFTNLGTASPAEVTVALFGFGLQIYLDFTGYVDMARGVSRMLGIELMVNFDAPYLSTSPREFWRRWHISLSQWLRDYLYISLGGNRHGLARHLAALMTTMVLGGLWHGAGLNFMIWGGLQGLYLVLNVLWDKYIFPRRKPLPGSQSQASPALSVRLPRLRAAAGWCITFLAMNYAWLYFRCHTFAEATLANQKLLEWLAHPVLPKVVPGLVVLVAMVAAMECIIRFKPEAMELRCSDLTLRRALLQGTAGGLLFVGGIILLTGIPTQQFIYFQF